MSFQVAAACRSPVSASTSLSLAGLSRTRMSKKGKAVPRTRCGIWRSRPLEACFRACAGESWQQLTHQTQQSVSISVRISALSRVHPHPSTKQVKVKPNRSGVVESQATSPDTRDQQSQVPYLMGRCRREPKVAGSRWGPFPATKKVTVVVAAQYSAHGIRRRGIGGYGFPKGD